MSVTFLLAAADRAADLADPEALTPPAAASLTSLPDVLLLSIVQLLPLHDRVRATRFSRWFAHELPRAHQLRHTVAFVLGSASYRVHDRDLVSLLRRIDAVHVTRDLDLKACGPQVTGAGIEPLHGSRVLEEINLCGRRNEPGAHQRIVGGPREQPRRRDGELDVITAHRTLMSMVDGAASTRLRRVRYACVVYRPEHDDVDDAAFYDVDYNLMDGLAAVVSTLGVLQCEREGLRKTRCAHCGKDSANVDANARLKFVHTLQAVHACWRCGLRSCNTVCNGYNDDDDDPKCPKLLQCDTCAEFFCLRCQPAQGTCEECGLTMCEACHDMGECQGCGVLFCSGCIEQSCAFCGGMYCERCLEQDPFDVCSICEDSRCPRCLDGEMEMCDVCEQMVCDACGACEQCERCCWQVCDACSGLCGCDRIRGVIDQSKVPVTRRR